MDLIIRVKEIRGQCAAHKVGDTFYLREGYKLESDKPVCMHALASLLPHYNAFRFADPVQWGASGKREFDKVYFQCLDPYEFTGGGTAIFEITRANP